MEGPYPQIVRDPLSDALGVVVSDVRCCCANRGDQHRGGCSDYGYVHFACTAWRVRRQGRREPSMEMVTPDDVVQDDFERPRPSQTHQGLDDHGHKYDRESPTVR